MTKAKSTFIPGPKPDPTAPPHGDFDPDDLATPENTPTDPFARPVRLYTDEERRVFHQEYE